MILIDVIPNLDSLNEEDTLYAQRPLKPNSITIVTVEPAGGGVPDQATSINAEYFLEVFLANQFLHVWLSTLARAPSLEEQCLRLIQYAILDA